MNKIKTFFVCFIFFVSLFFSFNKPTFVYAEEECEFDKDWKTIVTDYESLTQIDFLKTLPSGYEDTGKTISTKIKIYRSSIDSTKIAFVFDGVIQAPANCDFIFNKCSELSTINFNNFNTNNVTRMISMFSMCENLIQLDLTGFTTTSLLATNSMFDSCSSLKFIDLSSFDTSNVVNMLQMFKNCTSLSGSFGKDGTAVKIGDGFDTSKVFTISNMFVNCSKIISMDMSNFDFSSLNSNPYMPDGTSGVFMNCAFNVIVAPKIIPEGIEINMGGGKYYDKTTNAQYTILNSSLAGKRLIKHNIHSFVDCVCTTCGFIDHNYGEWIEEIPAYCGNLGTKGHYHCDKCNKNFDIEFNEILDLSFIATDHNYSDSWSMDEHNHWHECPCGLKNEEASHTFGEWSIEIEPTPTVPGKRNHYCIICGYKESELIYHTHEYTGEWKYDGEYHWQECSCGEKGNAKTHEYGEWTITKEATTSETGIKERECSVCGYKQKESIPQIPHTHEYTGEWKYDEECHWQECSCGEKGNAKTHEYGEWTITKEATTSETGIKERECSVCGYKQKESIPQIPHTHEYTGEWKYDEECHWHECSCGEKTDKETHVYGDWIIVKEATTKETGLEEQTCICGHKNTRSIPILQSSIPVGFIIGMSILGGSLALIFAYGLMYIIWSKNGKGLKFLIPSYTWIRKKIKKQK